MRDNNHCDDFDKIRRCPSNCISFYSITGPTGSQGNPTPTGCDSNCESAIRSYLPVGTTAVDINAGGQTVAQGTILKSGYGMVVVVGNNNSDPTFVSLCKAEIINKATS